MHSTYLVCRKAVSLCRDDEDRAALAKRLRYEFRQCVLTGNHTEASLFLNFLEEIGAVSASDRLFDILKTSRIPLNWFREMYHALRFRSRF